MQIVGFLMGRLKYRAYLTFAHFVVSYESLEGSKIEHNGFDDMVFERRPIFALRVLCTFQGDELHILRGSWDWYRNREKSGKLI